MSAWTIDDEGIHWAKFRGRTPKCNGCIIAEDHEGNRAPGTWDYKTGFVNLFDIPMGPLVRWTYARIVQYHSESENVCTIFYDNGKEVDIKELYDLS